MKFALAQLLRIPVPSLKLLEFVCECGCTNTLHFRYVHESPEHTCTRCGLIQNVDIQAELIANKHRERDPMWTPFAFFLAAFALSFLFPSQWAEAAWVYVPDTLMVAQQSSLTVVGATPQPISVALAPFSGVSFAVDPVTLAASPLSALPVLPPLDPAMVGGAVGGADPFPPIDFLSVSTVTGAAIFLWILGYSGGVLLSVFKRPA